MKKLGANVAILCLACFLLLSLSGADSLALAQEAPHLTAEQAITAARRNAKPESSFIVLREITASTDSRRIADQALALAKADKIELYENGILVNLLRSGG